MSEAVKIISTWNSELIDTLWNVNLTYAIWLSGSRRINRYIMECKCNGQGKRNHQKLLN